MKARLASGDLVGTKLKITQSYIAIVIRNETLSRNLVVAHPFCNSSAIVLGFRVTLISQMRAKKDSYSKIILTPN